MAFEADKVAFLDIDGTYLTRVLQDWYTFCGNFLILFLFYKIVTVSDVFFQVHEIFFKCMYILMN